VIGPGVNGEYGNSFDVLGNSGSGMNGHFNASFKQQIGWLTTDLYTPVTSSGTYRIWQFDQPLADPGRRFALQITKDSQRDYWVEFRQKFTTNAWIMNGVHVNWDRWGENGVETSTQGSNGGAQLLDMSPGSSNGLEQCRTGCRAHVFRFGSGHPHHSRGEECDNAAEHGRAGDAGR